jgi:signal transduction histidine kinase
VRHELESFLGKRFFRGHAGARELARALAAQELRADQAGRLAELGQFVSAVAHEVRNPLGVLSANLKLLERGGADPELAQAMREQIARASHFVDELLTYGRPRPLELRKLEADALLDLALSTARQGLSADGSLAAALDAVQIERVRAPLLELEADQAQLVQLLVVLLENALLAVIELSPARLRLSVLPDGDRVRLRVEDGGVGIAPEVLPRLFQPFVTGRKREGPRRGTGLGLAIARGIAERHGGSIRADRSDLGGALFEVELPVAQPLLAAASA